MLTGTIAPDALSSWELPPPAARKSGDIEPICCFDSAQAAIKFLAGQDRRGGRVLMAENRERVQWVATGE